MVSFSASGTPGVLRRAQPTDALPVPVLADPQTAASAGPDGRIAVTVDGLPVVARVVGVHSRFPTLDSDAAGLVIADEATLAAALDAQLPGQGQPDALWISTGHPARLRAALGSGMLAQLESSVSLSRSAAALIRVLDRPGDNRCSHAQGVTSFPLSPFRIASRRSALALNWFVTLWLASAR